MEPSKGIYFIAVGELYVNQAILAAKTIKTHSPDLSITLYTDVDQSTISLPLFDNIITVNKKKVDQNLKTHDKVLGLIHTPYDYTLFLDADMYIMEDLSPVFHLLDNFDLAVCHAHSREYMIKLYQNYHEIKGNYIPYSFPVFQSGLILYKKNEKVVKFLHNFVDAYEKNNFHMDQFSLRELLWESDLRFLVLPEEYNFNRTQHIIRWSEHDNNVARPKIFHYTLNKGDNIPELIEETLEKAKNQYNQENIDYKNKIELLNQEFEMMKNSKFGKLRALYKKKNELLNQENIDYKNKIELLNQENIDYKNKIELLNQEFELLKNSKLGKLKVIYKKFFNYN